MEPLSVLVTFATAGVLLWAGLEKLGNNPDFRTTLTALSLPAPVVSAGGYGVPAVELMTAAALMVLPGQWWSQLAVAVLGVVFAAAGGLALRLGRPIACSCLGATGGGQLGWRQVLALPGWLAAAALLQVHTLGWSWRLGLQYLAALVVLLGAIRAVAVIRAWRSAACDRTSLDEASIVPRPIFADSPLSGGMQ